MDVRSEGPLKVGSLVFRSQGGTWTFTIVAKATFRLAPDVSPIVQDGEPVWEVDVRSDSAPLASLVWASDLVPWKQAPEVIVTGSARAAPGKTLRSAVVRVAVGDVDKALEVQGDRFFADDGLLSDAAPWSEMPLVWDRAAGGPGTLNPVGIVTGPSALADAEGRIFLPNLWPAWSSISGPEDRLEPVGLGPMAPDWPLRASRVREAISWDKPLPPDFDASYFNVAPPDQRLSSFSGRETITLEHLHPEHPRLTTTLEQISPMAMLERPDREGMPVTLARDTLWIDADRGLAMLTFRGHVALFDPMEVGTITVRVPGTATANPSPSAARGLPFRQAVGAPVGASALGRSMRLQTGVSAPVETPTLPRPGERPARRWSSPDQEQTGEIVLPIAAAPIALSAPLADLPISETPVSEPPQGTLGQRLVASQTTLAQTLHARAALAEKAKEEVFVPPPTDALTIPAPPPLWAGTSDELDAPVQAPAEPPLPEAPPPPVTLEGPPPLPVDAYPPERCARIAAEIDMKPGDEARILEEASLDEDTWARLGEHWDQTIDKELARHKNKTLRAYDAAYVARVEAERGPVVAEEYAKLSAANDMGGLDETVEALRIPKPGWPRIRRLWISAIAKDRALALTVRRLVDEALDR